jgi:hypothetical protein
LDYFSIQNYVYGHDKWLANELTHRTSIKVCSLYVASLFVAAI